jgi:hypothetical protein
MTIQEVITARESKFVEVDRVEWLLFLDASNPEGEMVVIHRELTAGAMRASADTVIVYRWQAKALSDPKAPIIKPIEFPQKDEEPVE